VAHLQADKALEEQVQQLEAKWRQHHLHELAQQSRTAAEHERQSISSAHASLDAQHKAALELALAEAQMRCALWDSG
jgi:hypothetical protein